MGRVYGGAALESPDWTNFRVPQEMPYSASMPIATILLALEGPVSPVDYARNTLLRFAYRTLPQFLREHGGKEEVRWTIDLLRQQRQNEDAAWADFLKEGRDHEEQRNDAEYYRWLISQGRKSSALHSILDLIWHQGFLSGELCSEIFVDVPPALQRWRKLNLTIGSYSPISSATQELLFRYSEWGDLSNYISFFFDRHAGPYDNTQKYEYIVRELKCRPEEVLVVSTVASELEAAQAAGGVTAFVERMGAPLASGAGHRQVADLRDLP